MNTPNALSPIAVAQLNPVVGDLAGNSARILAACEQAYAQGAKLVLTGELSLCGYQPEDLLLRPAFVRASEQALEALARQVQATCPDLCVLVGHPTHEMGDAKGVWDDARGAPPFFNAVSSLRDGKVAQTWRKQLLPNYAVFDEQRYFLPSEDSTVELLEVGGLQIGVLICEDAWAPQPALAAKAAGAQLLVVLNASPYYVGKAYDRVSQMQQLTQACGLPLIYAHMVGGQDELLFDGASFSLQAHGELAGMASAFTETLFITECARSDAGAITLHASTAPRLDSEHELWLALVLGLQDYVRKNGFSKVVLGLSGGIDSALVMALAVDALGAAQVHAVMMPSPYTAEISWVDARDMAARMGVRYDEISIKETFADFKQSLAPLFAGKPEDVTEENIQARIRGVLLMALSNKTGAMVLTTGNKSEYATGYCTLYGDMCGGYAPIKDVLKTTVFKLAHWRNAHDPFDTGSNPIPSRIISRPPSAELRPEQKDEDSLPPYAILDAMLVRYMEHNESIADLLAAGFSQAHVERMSRLVKINEYKRRQSAPGTRVSKRGFGRDWRMPITNRFLA